MDNGEANPLNLKEVRAFGMKGETQGEKENCKGTSTKILIRKNQLKDRNHQGIKKLTGTKSIHLNARKKIYTMEYIFSVYHC